MPDGLRRITLIGAGNVATQLGMGFQSAGLPILQVFSRRMDRASSLAAKLGASPTQELAHILDGADLYLICVSDDAIPDVARKLSDTILTGSLVCHTSGAKDLDPLCQYFSECGVFYPLQTLTYDSKITISEVPICISASNPYQEQNLMELATRISTIVRVIDDSARKWLHLSAVFANNFSNHMLTIADDICREKKVDFALLQPLIRQTVKNIEAKSPALAQTGPARRNDNQTILLHLELLKGHPQYELLYMACTDSIRQWHVNQNESSLDL